MVCADEMRAYQMGYDGIVIGVMDPCYGAWLRGQNDRRRDDEARFDTVPQESYRVRVPPAEDLTVGEYFVALIFGPISVGLTVLLVAFLAGWDHTKWALVSGVATFALLVVVGVLRWWDYVLALALVVGGGWWLLHMIGVVPGLPG